MKILNDPFCIPALFLLFSTCCHISYGTEDGGLISQVSHNPLQLGVRTQEFQHLQPAIANANGVPFTAGPVFAPASNPVYTRQPQELSDVIAENVLQFGHNLGLQLNSNAANSEIYSPLSVMSALSLLTLGAKGKSYQELKRILGFDQSAEIANNPGKYHQEFAALLDDVQNFVKNNGKGNRPQRKYAKWRDTEMKTPNPGKVRQAGDMDHVINVANGLFVQNGYSINPDYSQVVKSMYDSEITPLDFQRQSREARNYINSWVSDKTRGKIPSIITDDIDKSINVILASVVYFKGFWETPFFPRSTNEDNFYPDGVNGAAIRVQMMATGGYFPFYDAKEYDCRIIGLPYRGNETTMYVIQPNDSSRQKLRSLQSMLNAQKINEMIDNMAWKTTIMVFPKMHFTRSLNMKNILQSMGVRDIFERGFSDLSLLGEARRAAVAIPSNQFANDRAQAVFGQGIVSAPKQRPLSTQLLDRFHEPALRVTSRFGVPEEEANKNTMAEGTPSGENKHPCGYDDYSENSHRLSKRQAPVSSLNALAKLEDDRSKTNSYGSDLYVSDILHKVDVTVDEYGTEAAAATLSYLLRSGTDVVFRGDTPFLVLIRHDPTKLPLFYGIINRPEL